MASAGLTTVVFYHSPADKLAKAQAEAAPFDLVPDPAKKIFAAYGVETGLRGLVSRTVMRDYAKAMAAGYPSGLLTSDGGITGNPADFIVDESGRIVFAHSGRQYADSLEASDVVAALRTAPRRSTFPRDEPVVAAR